MSKRPQMARRLLAIAIAVVLLAFFSVPLGFIAYGAAGGLLGGVIIVGMLILLQIPMFLLKPRPAKRWEAILFALLWLACVVGG